MTGTASDFHRFSPELVPVVGAIFQLYSRHRALLRMLEHHGIVQRERFEAERTSLAA